MFDTLTLSRSLTCKHKFAWWLYLINCFSLRDDLAEYEFSPDFGVGMDECEGLAERELFVDDEHFKEFKPERIITEIIITYLGGTLGGINVKNIWKRRKIKV